MAQLRYEIIDGEQRLVVNDSFSAALYLERIAEIAQDLSATRKNQCREGMYPLQRIGKKANAYLIDALLVPAREMFAHFPVHTFHPFIALFMDCAIEVGLHECIERQSCVVFEPTRWHSLRTEFVDLMRTRRSKRTFCRALRAHKNRCARNMRSAEEYVDGLFDHYSRLLVLRVDLSFNMGMDAAHDWSKARAYRESLISFLNRDLPKLLQSEKHKEEGKKPIPLAGYLIGTEYGADTGWHFHVTIFLDGDHFWKDEAIASFITSQWRSSLTGGNGRYHSCNLFKESYNELGIGMVHYDKAEKRQILKSRVTQYACKGCYYAAAQIGPNDRLLNKGSLPKKKSTGGRPRLYEHAPVSGRVLTHVYSSKTKRFHRLLIERDARKPS